MEEAVDIKGEVDDDDDESAINNGDDDNMLEEVDDASLNMTANSSLQNLSGNGQVPYQAQRIKCRLCNKRVSTKTGLKKHSAYF